MFWELAYTSTDEEYGRKDCTIYIPVRKTVEEVAMFDEKGKRLYRHERRTIILKHIHCYCTSDINANSGELLNPMS